MAYFAPDFTGICFEGVLCARNEDKKGARDWVLPNSLQRFHTIISKSFFERILKSGKNL
jgi:hypothetical protein